MAKQKGLHRLSGSLDGLTYYSTKHGDLVRKKPEISAERRKNAPEYENIRRSNSEFGYASRIGKLLRRGVKKITSVKAPGTTNTRLASYIREVAALDAAHMPGERMITPENAGLLQGFEWDEDAGVLAALHANYKVNIDTDNNRVSFSIKGFKVDDMVEWPGRATHVDLILGVTAIDYEADDEESTFDGAGALFIEGARPVDVLLECDIPGNAGDLVVVGLGIQMYKEVNGWMNKVKTGSGYVILKAVMEEVVSRGQLAESRG